MYETAANINKSKSKSSEISPKMNAYQDNAKNESEASMNPNSRISQRADQELYCSPDYTTIRLDSGNVHYSPTISFPKGKYQC